jgi:hypothetical protein
MNIRSRVAFGATAAVSTLTWVTGFPIQMGVTSAHAQDSSFWSFLKEGQTIRRCPPTSAAHLSADASLARLNDHIVRLDDIDRLDPALKELHQLLRTECFWMPPRRVDCRLPTRRGRSRSGGLPEEKGGSPAISSCRAMEKCRRFGLISSSRPTLAARSISKLPLTTGCKVSCVRRGTARVGLAPVAGCCAPASSSRHSRDQTGETPRTCAR